MKLFTFFNGLFISFYAGSLLAVEKEISTPAKVIVDPLSGANIVQMIAGLLFVLLMVIFIAWMVRRVGGVSLSGGRGLNIICGISMGSRERVVLLQVGEEQVLIGVSPGRIQKLHVLGTPIDLKNNSQEKINFSSKFAEVLRGNKK